MQNKKLLLKKIHSRIRPVEIKTRNEFNPRATDHSHSDSQSCDPIKYKHISACIEDSIFYLPCIVNKFTTNSILPVYAYWFCHLAFHSANIRISNRTRRRVHIMPWATSIKRIGKMHIGYLSPGEGDSISGTGCRDHRFNLARLFHTFFDRFHYKAFIILIPVGEISLFFKYKHRRIYGKMAGLA